MNCYENKTADNSPVLEKPAKKGSLYGGLKFMCLWLVSSLITTAYTNTSTRISALWLIFNTSDTFLMLLSTMLLGYGLNTENPYVVLPWIAVSGWNMYHLELNGFLNFYNIFTKAKYASRLGSLTCGIMFLTIVTKAVLIIRVASLGAKMWYQNKLQQDTLKKNN
ncbi:hypothetical protein PPYR_13342 [Photinus pyralis]|uniref:Uncharacterized protein n=1 Tax=Photinus pyralis TaxID=7054 RepID=A0A5N4A8S9_PHOPY|nr:uncharacterized protein LOC116178751 [Photinus pyralis]KAB0793722.1 hypothetical protein PPYR_13342 [Photinus pyralis]